MITKKQFDYLLQFDEQSTSGPKYSESRIDAAEKYIFDHAKWEAIKPESKNSRVEYNIKSYGKKLGSKILFWHEFFNAWPDTIEARFDALTKTGGRAMSQDVINATIQHIKTGDNMHKCAMDNGCFMGSVKSALAKIEKFDAAVEQYNEI